MDIANYIKSTLSMVDVAEMYGFHPNRSGYISCPFHSEKTASCRVWAEPGRGFHCFGCGVGGDVIDFVMLLLKIPFPAAVERLNHDFGLGLVNTRPSPESLKALEQRRREREEKRAREEKEYREKAAEFRRLREIINTAEPFSDEWTEAVHKIDYLEYWLDEHL